jgi:serine-type D-Ala-D-Ala carboxypeptidase (penicillin-binding protein 5/6)
MTQRIQVLRPVERPGRRGRRSVLVVLAAAAAAAAVSFVVWQRYTNSDSVSTSAASQHHVTLHTQSKPLEPLVVGAPHVRRSLKPPVGARAAIVIDAATGRVVYALHSHRRLPIASTTKVMTALLVVQRQRLSTIVRIGPAVPRVPLIKEGLRFGEQVPVRKLLYGLLLYSGNDDALALAIATGGSRSVFVQLMNAKAKSLGLRDTHFRSPSGVIDEDNYSSASDLAALTRVALRNAIFRRIVRTREKTVSWPPPTFAKTYVNKNKLLGRYAGAIGVKTGWTTKAGHCLVAAARRHGVTLVAVLLHDPNPYPDARRLLDLGFRHAGH